MADPGAHVAVVDRHFPSGIRFIEVQLTAFSVAGKTIFHSKALKPGGSQCAFIVGEILQVEFVSEHADLVCRQFHRSILVPGIHLNIPGFLLIGQEGDIGFAAAVGIHNV